jgi:DNA repair exonuclease SbcCD ATPase subunit
MKIKYLLLENFSGIYAGTNKTKLEIDFKNNKNRIIVFNGENGCGKSTCLSLMHPLRGTNDDRDKTMILPNELGHKICKIDYNGDEYICEHYYGKKNKSYISKNGKELNENGNIKSFNTIVKEELGIDEEYFKIGRIGDNVSNFIDLPTAKRKAFINEFIPSIDDFLQAFDVVKDKYTSANAEIKVLKSNIEKYSHLRELQDIIDEVKTLEKERNNLNKSLNSKQNKLDSFEEEEKKLYQNIIDLCEENNILWCGFEELEIKLDNKDLELTRVKDNLEIKLFDLIEKFKIDKTRDIDEYMRELENRFSNTLSELKTNEENIKENIKRLNNEQNECQNKIEYYEDKLNNDKYHLSEDNLKILLNDLEIKKKDLSIIDKEIQLFKKSLLERELKEILEFYDENGFNYKNIKSIFDEITIIRSNYDINIINKYYNKKRPDKFNIKEKIKEIEAMIQTNKNLLIEYNNHKKIAEEILPLRPSECNINNCEFIKTSLEYLNSEVPEIPNIEATIESLIKEKESLEKDLEEACLIDELYVEMKELKHKLEIVLPKYYIDKIYTKKLLLDNINDLDITIGLDKLNQFINNLKNKSIIEDLIERLESSINNHNMSSELYKEYLSQLEEYNNKLEEVISEIENNNEELNKCSAKVNIYEKKLNIAKTVSALNKQYKEALQEFKEFKIIYNNFVETINEYKNYRIKNNIENIEEEIEGLRNKINELDIKINNENVSIQIIKDNMDTLETIEKDFTLLTDLKNALDPKKGIPVIFANEYLKNISTKANKLLEVAYDNSFKIKFEVTANDFTIPVYKGDGTTLNDIKLASQGETSLTNVSLSLAMLECMIEKYNVIYLDEVDSVLSTENRKLFIDLLNRQLDSLDIEQCFIITHNGEFYNNDCDLILMNGHDCNVNDKTFMQNKNILLNLEG